MEQFTKNWIATFVINKGLERLYENNKSVQDAFDSSKTKAIYNHDGAGTFMKKVLTSHLQNSLNNRPVKFDVADQKTKNIVDTEHSNVAIAEVVEHHFRKILTQKLYFSLIVIVIFLMIISIKHPNHEGVVVLLIFYFCSLVQVVRLKRLTKFYIKMKKIRVNSGPIYGLTLFWSIFKDLNNRSNIVCVLSLIFFLFGFYFKPVNDKGIDKYMATKKIHGRFMMSSFFIILIWDLVSYKFINNI